MDVKIQQDLRVSMPPGYLLESNQCIGKFLIKQTRLLTVCLVTMAVLNGIHRELKIFVVYIQISTNVMTEHVRCTGIHLS